MSLLSSLLTIKRRLLASAGALAIAFLAVANVWAGTATQAQLGAMRLDPKNATGGTDLYSRNFGWGTNLVGLPGRSGLDLNFGISYNSLVWLKDATNSEMIFDPDTNNVSPGFQLGFPTIERAYFDSTKSKYVFFMLEPDGSRKDFRQVETSNTFDSGDSTNEQLNIINTGKTLTGSPALIDITVFSADGMMHHYIWNSAISRYVCAEVKDRNGNYIHIDYNTYGLISSVTDTLGRVVTVNYDTTNYPSSITQTWKDTNGLGSNVTHTWATFDYTNATVSTTFTGFTVIGPANSSTVKVLQKITYPDGSFTKFDYNGYIQVQKISQVAADSTSHVLNYVSTDLDSVSGTETDCPRFGATRSWVENFNLSGGTPQEVVTTNTAPSSSSFTGPDGSITTSVVKIGITGDPYNHYTRIHFEPSGSYKEGLTHATEDCTDTGSSCSTRVRWTWNSWTQDNTGVSYITNPRILETQVGDGTNTKRTTIDYGSNGYGLPEKVKVYDTDLTTVLKTQVSSYNLSSTYTNLRIIGLPSESKLYEGTDTSGTLMSKVTYAYDEGNMTGTDPIQNISPTQHDNTNYSSSYVTGRGLLTTVTRWDATAPTTSGSAVSSTMKYNTAGAVVSKTDPLSHTVKIAYADVWNDLVSRTTYAYPTTLTDQAGNSSTVIYRYDIGTNVEATSPAPAGQTYGKTSHRDYETATGRLLKNSVLVNATLQYYTRYEYPTNGIQSKVFTTVIDTDADGPDADDEVLGESWSDGAGRTLGTRTEHPGSTGGWSATKTDYDILGRAYRTSVPTEVSVATPYDPAHWTAAGDDSTRGFIYNYTEYDWKGRTTRTVPSDSTGSDGKDTLISYAGCGCAGGQLTTIQGPSVARDDTTGNARRKQMVYDDILGRNVKTEVYGWDGSTVYTTTVNTFNGRDQITNTRQYAGATTSSTYQDVTMSYDGHGRMATRHYPIEDSGTYTSWTYNTDDSISEIVDPRLAVTDFTYNSRGMTTQIAYTPFSGGVDTPTVDYAYDNAGNRTSMTTAGVSVVSYNYNELSQLTSETTNFDDLSGDLTIAYTYQLRGGLKSIKDPYNVEVDYTNDKVGRVTAVTGDPVGNDTTGHYADDITYRAFGGVKQMDYNLPAGDSHIKLDYDSGLRVSHSEASLSGSTTSYLLNANYSYMADGRSAGKDDLLDDAWDRTNKFDFAGRMSFNQFGLSSSIRVYEQTIGYDEFSDVTVRSTEYWGTGGGFGATVVNGRKTGPSNVPTYDAAGNVTFESQSSRERQTTTFDAAGRKTGVQDRFPLLGFSAWEEDETDYVFDGDGHPVIQKGRVRSSAATTWPTLSPLSYQVWSSVLGTSLTTVNPNETKKDTKVFAGGAQIATDDGTIVWKTADPVTGTSAFYAGNGTVAQKEEETEPLGGQSIELTAPPSYNSSYNDVLGKAGDPQWQCTVAKGMDSDFFEMPVHCQKQMAMQSSFSIAAAFGYSTFDENPQKLASVVDSPLRMPGLSGGNNSASTTALALAASSTFKFSKGDAEETPGCDTQNCVVDVRDPDIPFEDASTSGGEKLDDGTVDILRKNLKKAVADKDCGDFVNAVLAALKDKTVNGNPVKKLTESIAERFEGIAKGRGFFLDNHDPAFGRYESGGITFGRPFNPTGTDITAYEISDTNYSILLPGLKKGGYEVTSALDTTLTLIHELVHSYYGSGFVTEHPEMDKAASIAINKVGIKGPIPAPTGSGHTFDGALMRACGKVKL